MSLDVYQRLLALAQQRAVPIASRRHRHLSPRPFVFAGYHLAGEPSAPVAFCYGSSRERPTLHVVVEPRDRQQRFAVLGHLARALARYLIRYAQTEPTVGRDGTAACCVDAPQLLVPNEATGNWLALLGQYLNVVDPDPVLKTAAAHLGWFAGRRYLPGSSAVLAATDLLTTHWRTGQLPNQDGHLGRLLAWIEGHPDDYRPMAAGPTSDPDWDRLVLRPAVEHAKPTGDIRRLRQALRDALEPAWRSAWAAYDLVNMLPPGEHVARRWESDRWSWTRHRQRLVEGTAGSHVRLADVPAYRFLHELETRTVTLERQMALDDPLLMARYVASGEAVAGTIVKVDSGHTERGGTGRPVLRPLLWLRVETAFDRPVGTQLWLGRIGMTVRSITGDIVQLLVTSGAVTRTRLDQLPEPDTEVLLAPFGPQQRFPDNLPDELPWPARQAAP